MRKPAGRTPIRAPIAVALMAFLAVAISAGQSNVSPPSYSKLSQTLLERAEAEVAKVRELVSQGALPQARLEEAERHLADVQDQATLSATLYNSTHVQDMTQAQASEMVAAAARRVERQQEVVNQRKKLLDMGIVARAEYKEAEDELATREETLALTQNRAKLLEQLAEMARTEQQLEQAARQANVMIRYDGNGSFSLGDLATIQRQFEQKFHHPLPVSALGQTLIHRAMGLDHRNRVDVALNPDGAEGVWLRHLLERLRVPYLAFRSAVAGAATAPHIHIGPGSTRLVTAPS